MRTPLASLCSGQINGLPEEGPLCYHNEPTVLKVLNGRNVYVCSRFPSHHCRACCPADIMLVEDIPLPASQDPQGMAFGSPISAPSSPIEQSEDGSLSTPREDAIPGEDDELTPSESTPPSQERTTPRMPPPAPNKSTSNGSFSSRRARGNSAVRSLTPVFNGFAAAATRANQMGGRFATLRPPAAAIAKMQRQMSGSMLETASQPSSATRKRPREDGDGTHSVRTVSRGKEPRGAVWMHNGNNNDASPL